MIRDVLKMGDTRLYRVAKAVETEFLRSEKFNILVDDMFATMDATQGVGLAAPQIGVDLQLVVFGCEQNARYPEAEPVPRSVLVNPEITPLTQDMQEDWEGCLSIPGMRGIVSRYSLIKYTGLDANGAPVERTAEGFHARVVQHECDHLIGRLYPSRITDFSKFGFIDALFPEDGASSPHE